MILSHYLSRLFITRTLAALLAFAALLQLLDLLDSASTVLARGGGAGDLLHYAVLRLPLILERVIPLSVLVGSLATLWGLAQHNEVTAFRAAGMTPYRLVATLMPAALIIAATHFLISDQIAPRTERAFLNWWKSTAPDETGDQPAEAKRIWLRVGGSILAIDKVEDRGHTLDGVELFERDAIGRLTGRVQAARATYEDGRWVLQDGRRFAVAGASTHTEPFERSDWAAALTPANVLDVANPPENLSRSRLRNILRGAWSGTQSPSYYRTRLYASYAGPLASLTMVLLAAPVAHGMRRRGTLSGGLALGLVTGLLFLVSNGLMMALGEAAVVPALLAAWAPTVLFAAFAGAVLVHIEG
jgi:lipopolysaccharide export system permease protein